MRKFKVYTYNVGSQTEKGSWIITDKKDTGIRCTSKKQEITAKDVCKFLKDEGILESADQRKINAVIGMDLIEVREKKTSKPICRLERTLL